MQPILGPEGIAYIQPVSGFSLAFSAKDRIRWAHIFQHLQRKGYSVEKAEIQAFLQVYQMKDPHLVY